TPGRFAAPPVWAPVAGISNPVPHPPVGSKRRENTGKSYRAPAPGRRFATPARKKAAGRLFSHQRTEDRGQMVEGWFASVFRRPIQGRFARFFRPPSSVLRRPVQADFPKP